MTEDSGELTEFEILLGTKVYEFMRKHYSDLDPYGQLPIRMDAIWAIEGRPDFGPFSKDLYSGPNWAEDFFRDHPKFKKLLDDPEIKALREKDREYQKKLAASTSGCFIATAAYGTPFSEEIDVLRNWRDTFLEASYPGRLFIRTYYSLSPPVADNISDSDGKRKIVRTALGPIVKILKDKYSNNN